ncbi:MAG: hypothetical protein QNJ07_16475 [Woeseiaceae bacterium]|nr:hypothetical protein [Woeseiaceae bacterium]
MNRLSIGLRLLFSVALGMSLLQACSVSGQPGNWTFDELLSAPTESEIAAVRREWSERSLQPLAIDVAGKHVVETAFGQFDVTVYSYRLDGALQYGAAFVPRNPSTESLSVVIGARGVRWDYPVRNLTDGPYAARVLGQRQNEFVFLSPALRGHSFRFGDVQYDAGGDRRDSWDGAADDMIAFLSVALANLPQADSENVIAFGASRGAGVALLHAARDSRVKAAVGFATPADFFRLMGRPGEDWGESLQEAYEDPQFPENSRESQFIEWFLEDREALPMNEIRRRIIASSPLYFVSDLPPTQLHHGADDAPVPARNARAIKDRFLALGMKEPEYDVFVYDDVGHRLDDAGAFETTRQFVFQSIASASASLQVPD